MRHLLLIVALAWPLTLVLGGCPPDEGDDDDVSGDDDDVSGDDDDASGDDDDASGDDDDVSDECADYRTVYPEGPYGTSQGSVLDDFPGMVDGQNTPVSLMDIYTDRTKVALVIANAFDT